MASRAESISSLMKWEFPRLCRGGSHFISQNNSTVAFSYDSAGRRTSLTLANGVSVAYGYDQASEPTTIQYQSVSAALGNLAYTYDLAGRRNGVTGSFTRT